MENRRPGGPMVPENEMNGLEKDHSAMNGDTYDLDKQKTITNGLDGQFFTEDELATAMTQSTLKPSRKERG